MGSLQNPPHRHRPGLRVPTFVILRQAAKRRRSGDPGPSRKTTQSTGFALGPRISPRIRSGVLPRMTKPGDRTRRPPSTNPPRLSPCNLALLDTDFRPGATFHSRPSGPDYDARKARLKSPWSLTVFDIAACRAPRPSRAPNDRRGRLNPRIAQGGHPLFWSMLPSHPKRRDQACVQPNRSSAPCRMNAAALRSTTAARRFRDRSRSSTRNRSTAAVDSRSS